MRTVTKCPACGDHNSLIIDSRTEYKSDYGFVRRRRECQSCGQRWSTMEVPYKAGQKMVEFIRMINED